jgi:uncharacterized protein
MKCLLVSATAALFFAVTAHAEVGDLLPDDGTLNPEEQTMNYFANRYDFGKGKSTACVYGYWATKSGNHVDARKIFDKCVEAGVDAAYAWQSYLYQNGFGVPRDLEKAADWDRRSAERGYKIGEFNYGLSLLRGYGVAQDIAAGKALIDRSAAQGLDSAKELRGSSYDPNVAVPDADDPRAY